MLNEQQRLVHNLRILKANNQVAVFHFSTQVISIQTIDLNTPEASGNHHVNLGKTLDLKLSLFHCENSLDSKALCDINA